MSTVTYNDGMNRSKPQYPTPTRYATSDEMIARAWEDVYYPRLFLSPRKVRMLAEPTRFTFTPLELIDRDRRLARNIERRMLYEN